MRIAFFTKMINARLFTSIFNRHKEDISVLYVFDKSCGKSEFNSVHLYDNDKDNTYEFLLVEKVEVAIIYGWSYKIPVSILHQIPFYNIHPSLLPLYRGPIPIIFQILNKEKKGGVTIHKVDENFDTGPIYRQKEILFSNNENFNSLNLKLSMCALHLLNEFFIDFKSNNITLCHQDNKKGSYYSYKDLEKYDFKETLGVTKDENFNYG
ncbi:MAG: hypothetical protein FWG91_00735 [Lachnospiraceae bacterium]|nr:hypothetical protein [Lachnospiraceae bacterium]